MVEEMEAVATAAVALVVVVMEEAVMAGGGGRGRSGGRRRRRWWRGGGGGEVEAVAMAGAVKEAEPRRVECERVFSVLTPCSS